MNPKDLIKVIWELGLIRGIKLWKEYKERIIQKKPKSDLKKGCGYYLILGRFNTTYDLNKKVLFEMVSGRKAYYKLISHKMFSDPWDMVKSSEWQLLGFEGEKLIEDMTFKEFIDFYKRENNHERKICV